MADRLHWIYTPEMEEEKKLEHGEGHGRCWTLDSSDGIGEKGMILYSHTNCSNRTQISFTGLENLQIKCFLCAFLALYTFMSCSSSK